MASLRRGSLLDRAVTALTATTMGLPTFFVGTVLAWLFAVKFGLLPVYGWSGWQAKILPVFVLGLIPFAQIVRVVRFETLEVLGRDYVLVARGKGLTHGQVVRRHVLRPALIPLASMPGPLLGQLVAGLFVVEWIFSIPGLGRYFIAAAEVGDYPLTLGLTVALDDHDRDRERPLRHRARDARSADARRRELSRAGQSRTKASTSERCACAMQTTVSAPP